MFRKNLITASLAAFIISGCSSSHGPEVQESFDRVNEHFKDTSEDQYAPNRPKRQLIGQVFSGPAYHDINDYSLIETDERILPSAYSDYSFISDKDGGSFTLDSFAALLFSSYGIVLDVSSPDLKVLAESIEDQSSESQNSTSLGVAADSTGTLTITNPISETKTMNRSKLKLKPFSFKGTVKELLDYVSILNGIKWKHDPAFNKSYMYMNETRQYTVFDFGKTIDQQSTITTTTQQDADSTSGGSQKQVSSKSTTDSWGDITKSVEGMLTPEVGKASFDQTTGLIVVTDNDYTLSRINNYVETLNKMSKTEITVEYRVIRFTYSEQNNKGINQNLLNNSLQNNLLGSFDVQTGIGSLSPNIPGNLGAFQEIMSGNFLSIANQSHQLLLGFLNKLGTAESTYENRVPIINNGIYTHSGSQNQEYISSIERSSFNNDSGQENITTNTDIAVDGVNITIQPRVAGDEIFVTYSIANSDFIGLSDAGLSSGLEGIQLKQDGSFNSEQTVILKNGQTRVIQLIHEKERNTDAQGLFDKGLWFLGGGENQEKTKSAIIVTMSAYYNN